MSASTAAIGISRRRGGARAAVLTGLIGAVLVGTFAVGRWSAPDPTANQPARPAAVFELQHSAPQHAGVVKEG
jgi:hypothetical protein